MHQIHKKKVREVKFCCCVLIEAPGRRLYQKILIPAKCWPLYNYCIPMEEKRHYLPLRINIKLMTPQVLGKF